MKTHPFTWLGLAIVVLGWVLLVFAIVAGDATLRAGALVATLTLRADVITVAQTAIVSGLGLTITGVLISGFGAFSHFFNAVLQRSSAPRATAPAPTPAPVAPYREPEFTSAAPVDAGVKVPPIVMPAERTPPPMPPPPLRPTPKERNYVVLPDGSVEVETMFGTRVFATLEEAREFIQ